MKLYIFKANQLEGVYLTPLFSMTNTPYPSPMEQCVGGPEEELCIHSGSYISIHFYEGVPSKQLLLHVNTNTSHRPHPHNRKLSADPAHHFLFSGSMVKYVVMSSARAYKKLCLICVYW